MCTYIHNCWCSVWCGLLITVNVHIAFHDGVFCWIQWTLLIIVNVSALPCSEINAVSCLRAGACDTVTDYSERLLAHIDIPSSFRRLKGQPYRLLITVNVALWCSVPRRCLTDYSERSADYSECLLRCGAMKGVWYWLQWTLERSRWEHGGYAKANPDVPVPVSCCLHQACQSLNQLNGHCLIATTRTHCGAEQSLIILLTPVNVCGFIPHLLTTVNIITRLVLLITVNVYGCAIMH